MENSQSQRFTKWRRHTVLLCFYVPLMFLYDSIMSIILWQPFLGWLWEAFCTLSSVSLQNLSILKWSTSWYSSSSSLDGKWLAQRLNLNPKVSGPQAEFIISFGTAWLGWGFMLNCESTSLTVIEQSCEQSWSPRMQLWVAQPCWHNCVFVLHN